jgi:hypothetical protein
MEHQVEDPPRSPPDFILYGCWSDKGDHPTTAITSDGTRPPLLEPQPVIVHEENVHHPIEGCILDLLAFMLLKNTLVLLFREPKDLSTLLPSLNVPW